MIINPPQHRDESLKRPIACIFPLLKFATERKLPIQRLLDGSGLKIMDFLDDRSMLEWSQEKRLTQNLINLCPEPELALKLGRFYETRSQGITGQLLLSAKDLREAINILVRFSTLSHVLFKLTFEHRIDVCRVHLRSRIPLAELRGFMMERDLSAAVTVIEDLFGLHQSELVSRVCLSHSPLAEKEQYDRFLINNVQFNQPANYVDLYPQQLTLPSRQPIKTAKQLLYQQCQTEMLLRGEMADSIADKVQWYLESQNRFPAMPEMANYLHMTERTLRRKLADEGHKYRSIVDDVRQIRSIELLNQKELSIESIAEELDYSEASAFINAFRRWHRKTPSQYRKEQC